MTDIALFGFGTIGSGVAKILLNEQKRISRAAGREVTLAKIVDLDITSDRGIAVPDGVLTTDADAVLNDPNIGIGIELIGGTTFAKTVVSRLLKSGKDVITANKALLAQHGGELFELARKYHRTIAFEASVCGGIPLLNALQTALQANAVQSITAIVNGTCNYILTQMETGNMSYGDAVRAAQKLGYAEANPAMDVDGTDSAQKLAILTQIAFGVNADWKHIPRTGIEDVDAVDFRYAKELGYRIKLLASAVRNENHDLELHVSPTLVKTDNPLSKVKDAFNAVRIVGDYVGPVFFQGLGAGSLPTASAIVGDMIDTVLGRTAITFKTLNLFNDQSPCAAAVNASGASYLRFNVADQPGVMREVAGVFGKNHISIASMIQHGPGTEMGNKTEYPDAVLLLTTHECQEKNLSAVIAALEALPVIHGKIVRLRISK